MTAHALRRSWIAVHRWVGLTVGLGIVVLGLSGSAAVFWNEITQVLDSQYRVTQPGMVYAPLQRMMETLHAAHPSRPDGWSVDFPYPENRHAPAWAVYESPEERADYYESPLYVAIDPFTAEILGQFYWGDTAVSWLFNLHSIFGIQSGDYGMTIVGIVGVFFLLLALSGLYLWWPVGRFSRVQFASTPALKGPRFEFHLHKLFGFYAMLVLLVVSVTGIIIVWPHEAAATVGVVQKINAPLVEDLEAPHVETIPGAAKLPFDIAAARARELFPAAELRHVSMPSATGTEAYGVTLRQPEERFDRMYPETRVWVNPYTGDVMKVVDAKTFNAARSIVGYNRYSFHNGAAFGLPGRIVMFIAGLLPLFFYFTGIRQWLRTRRA
jgi:uncharacterized iron-regulated membrane protein